MTAKVRISCAISCVFRISQALGFLVRHVEAKSLINKPRIPHRLIANITVASDDISFAYSTETFANMRHRVTGYLQPEGNYFKHLLYYHG